MLTDKHAGPATPIAHSVSMAVLIGLAVLVNGNDEVLGLSESLSMVLIGLLLVVSIGTGLVLILTRRRTWCVVSVISLILCTMLYSGFVMECVHAFRVWTRSN